MGFLSRRREKRFGLNESNFIWQLLNLGTKTKAGQNVTVDTALNVTTVYACVRVIAESIAGTPFFVYKRTKDPETKKDIKQRDTKHPLSDILRVAPNKWTTAFEFKEFIGYSLSLWGNFYAFKIQNGLGRIMGLQPLLPGSVKVERKDGEIFYTYTPEGITKPIIFRQGEIWHIKGLSTDGLVGLSPVRLMREAIGLAMSAEEYGAKFFENDARPTVALKTPAKLDKDTEKALKESWNDSYNRTGQGRGTAILQGGWDIQLIGMPNEDAQFLETRQFQVSDIARAFRVPAVMIGLDDKTSTFASAEQFFLSFVTYTMRPWLIRIENSANFHLLSEADRKKFFTEFQIGALMRGDLKSRYGAYAIALQSRFMSVNEVRALENMNPIENGDVFENPVITPGPPDDGNEPDDEDIDDEE